jgi:three-Cys-motif partner protein
MTPRGEGPILARDGLIARDNGPWAKEKLSFLDEFVPSALRATEPKLQRYYIDLFAGPGINIDGGSADREEFPGSALRVLPMSAPGNDRIAFTHTVLVNKNADECRALEQRVDRLFQEGRIAMPQSHIKHVCGDANAEVGAILEGIHRLAYLLVFADIENPTQWPWTTVAELRRHGHSSVDLYLLFPLDMALNRMISYNSDATEDNARALTTFFGNERWRDIANRRITDAQSAQLRREVLELYAEGLRGLGWAYVNVVRNVHRVGQQGLYKMLLASAHEAGDKIAKWSAGQPDKKRGQMGLF